jgi:hypothetical protein
MAFTLPAFNLAVNLWRVGDPPIPAPSTRTFMANLARGNRHVITGYLGDFGQNPILEMMLLCPKLTDIRPYVSGFFNDLVEVPAGSGRYYVVFSVDDCAKGFANEYRCALLIRGDSQDTYVASGNPWGGLDWVMPMA